MIAGTYHDPDTGKTYEVSANEENPCLSYTIVDIASGEVVAPNAFMMAWNLDDESDGDDLFFAYQDQYPDALVMRPYGLFCPRLVVLAKWRVGGVMPPFICTGTSEIQRDGPCDETLYWMSEW